MTSLEEELRRISQRVAMRALRRLGNETGCGMPVDALQVLRDEVANAIDLVLSFHTWMPCNNCDGFDLTCEVCHGEGSVRRRLCDMVLTI